MIKMESVQQQVVRNFFTTYRERSDRNTRCFDCMQENPAWASVNNGILLCIGCTSLHRTMGSQVSMIRSVNLDIWNDRQLALMDKGGNDLLYSHFEKYDLNSEDPVTKYSSKAAHYYRKMLSAQASNDEAAIALLEQTGMPSYEEGRVPSYSQSPIPSPQFQTEETHDPQNDPQFTYRSQPTEEEKDVPQMVIPDSDENQVLNEIRYEWNPKVRSNTGKVLHSIDQAVQKVKQAEVVQKVQHSLEESKAVQKIVTSSKSAFGFLSSKTKTVVQKVDHKIEEMPKLSKAIDNTVIGVGKATKVIEKGFSKFMVKLGLMKKAEPTQFVIGQFEEIDIPQQEQQKVELINEPEQQIISDQHAINRSSSEASERPMLENEAKNYQ